MGQPRPLFVYCRSFQTNNSIFTTNECEKMSCPSSIRRRDSNPRPFEYESYLIATRRGLPPTLIILAYILWLILSIDSSLHYFFLAVSNSFSWSLWQLLFILWCYIFVFSILHFFQYFLLRNLVLLFWMFQFIF